MVHDYNTIREKARTSQDEPRFTNEGYGEQYIDYKLPEKMKF